MTGETSTAPRRVLLVEANEDGTAGGSHRCLYDIATHLDSRFVTPVALFYEPSWIADELAAHGVDTRVWAGIRSSERVGGDRRTWVGRRLTDVRSAWRRALFLRSEHISLVHLNNSPVYGHADWIPAALLAHVPIIAHARGPVLQPRRRVARWIQSAYRRVIAISAYIEADLIRAGFPPRKVELIYDGVDTASILRAAVGTSELVRREFSVEQDHVLGVMVGHLKSWKGQHVVLQALLQLPERALRQLRFLFVGGAASSERAYVGQLQGLAADERLRGVVRFVGERRDALAVMAAADFVVHASTLPEPFGLVVVEAMALGKAVIASRLGGPVETVAPGCGLLCTPDDAPELSDLIRRLVESPAERQGFAVPARARAEEFSIERNVRAIEALYRSVLNGS